MLKNINLVKHFLFLPILGSTKIERLLFLKFLKNLAFFDSYFWPFNKSEEKIKVIFVISAIMPPIWNVFIKSHWHDEKFAIALCSWLSLWLTKRGSEWNWISQTLMKRPLLIRAKNRPATYFGQCTTIFINGIFSQKSRGCSFFPFLNVFTLCHIADLERE